MNRALALLCFSVALLVPPPASHAGKKNDEPGELLLVSEGNRLRRIDLDTVGARDGLLEETWIERASLDPSRGRDVNGMICALPDGSGRFVQGEDTNQPSPPPGWGVFAPSGTQVGKLTATYFTSSAEPHGCAFADADRLFTTEVGNQGPGDPFGQLLLWFGPFDRFPGPAGAYPETDVPSDHFCKIAIDIGTAGGIAIDSAGRVYVASASGFEILRFSPPFPSGPDADGGCGGSDPLGSPLAEGVDREVFASADSANGLITFTGLAIGPNGNLFAASVVTGRIAEYDLGGNLVRLVVDPPEATLPVSTGTPQGLAFDGEGTLYYADLDLQGDFPFDVGPGDDGKVWRVEFEKGEPLPPEIVIDGLAFPDGLGVVAGDLERTGRVGRRKRESRSFGGGPERLFFDRKEKKLKAKKIDRLTERWRFLTDAIVTSSPAVAALSVDGKRTQIVYFTSWDGHVYAVRLSDGSELWHFFGDPQPGASFPAASSPHVEEVDGREVVFAALGEILYALDALSGEEIWRFTAGTGCRDALGQPPGACAFDGERNEIETSPIVGDGRVYFGMDVNDSSRGKGGFYAVDVRDGRLEWFFDLETAATCVPDPGDDIRRFDGYHGEDELGLPAGFLTTRAGCGFDRTTTGCGNVWSSPALDDERGLIFFGSSNCDTDDDPGTPLPSPPMPAHDEALVALRLDGTPAWRWRPREVDNGDLAFGATPNLFSIERGKRKVDVVGIGNKDGTYYVVDREGVNAENGVAWDDADPSGLPYWATNVVPGGPVGGIIGTAAVDTKRGRIHFATAPGFDPLSPQRPTVHALDANSGEVLWQAGRDGERDDASFGPTAVANGLVFVGSIVSPNLRIYDGATGALLHERLIGSRLLGSAIASGPAIVDGIVLVGTGIGTRTGNPASPSDITAGFASSLVALCIEGSASCK